MVLEQVLGLDPPQMKTNQEDDDSQLQHPLEIHLKHSTVTIPDGSPCPLVQPQTGVAALHEYAQWITELNNKQADAERE